MKNAMFMGMCLLLCLGMSAFGQDQMKKKVDTTQRKEGMMGKNKMMKDCLIMKEGKMWVMKDGKSTEMEKDMMMPNGSTVMTTGEVKLKDGSSVVLMEGDMVDMKGNIMTAKGDKMKKDMMKKDTTKKDDMSEK